MPTEKKVAVAVVKELTDREKFVERKKAAALVHVKKRERVHAGLENANA